MELSSGIQKQFKKLFVLDEDGLRRIEGVLSKASSTYKDKLEVVFHVKREDDRFYETHSIDDVLLDPNVRERRIRLLAVELRSTALESKETQDNRIAWVVFDKDQPPMQRPRVRIRIACADKTWALLLADELEPQIERLFRIKAFPTKVFLLAAPIVGLITYRIAKHFGATLSEGVGSGAVATGIVAFTYAFLGFYVHYIAESPPPMFRRLLDEPVFLWGDEAAAFAERETFRRNVVWVVGIGFIVSLGAGIATLLLQ